MGVDAVTERTFTLGDFATVGGALIEQAELRYRVLGDVEAAREHGWILVFHALTGSSDVEAWWGPLIGPGLALDTTRHAIVAANLLGSCYGSTGPREWAQRTSEPFPVLTPVDLERTFGLTGGNIFQGAMSLNQLFAFRPIPGWAGYRTPVKGLYLCGSAAHPGGGVIGAAGLNAARVILGRA